MAKKRVFVSFDYDNDSNLKELLIGQSRNSDSPFELSDWSVKDHLTGNWKEKVRLRLRSVDLICVLCGKKTHTAMGVAAELTIAKEENIPYFLLAGYSNQSTKPTNAKDTDKLYTWNWDNLKVLIGGSR
jgi:MTH538 TIR-like domain (DUF1863)